MRILILADTHIPKRAKALPQAVREALPRADLILHAGDIVTEAVLDELGAFAPVTAVAGNNDVPELRARLPSTTIIRAGEHRIGLVHGDGARGTTFTRAAAAFAPGEVSCVVFGHSHQPMALWQQGILYLNPGSPTDRRRQPRYSFAWLTAAETLCPELVYFESR